MRISSTLVRGLGRWDLVALVINSIIGAFAVCEAKPLARSSTTRHADSIFTVRPARKFSVKFSTFSGIINNV